MNLNQIRLLEACYFYLLERLSPEVKDTLETDDLVFEANGNLYQFSTFQNEPFQLNFVEYELQPYELREMNTDISFQDIYKSLKLQGQQLSTLVQLSDIDIVCHQIFKLLSNADIAFLEEKYPDFKTTDYVYDLRNLTIDKNFPVYRFPKGTSFNFVALG